MIFKKSKSQLRAFIRRIEYVFPHQLFFKFFSANLIKCSPFVALAGGYAMLTHALMSSRPANF